MLVCLPLLVSSRWLPVLVLFKELAPLSTSCHLSLIRPSVQQLRFARMVTWIWTYLDAIVCFLALDSNLTHQCFFYLSMIYDGSNYIEVA